MFPSSDLILYAYTEARNMGLNKPLDIQLDPSQSLDALYSPNELVHKIRLKRPSKLELRHEMGHGYVAEKHPRLFKFLNTIDTPCQFLYNKFGKMGGVLYFALPQVLIGIDFLYNLSRGSVGISLPSILIGASMFVPSILSEGVASYFGERYKPRNRNI